MFYNVISRNKSTITKTKYKISSSLCGINDSIILIKSITSTPYSKGLNFYWILTNYYLSMKDKM